ELARFRFKSWTHTSERRQRYRAALAGASVELYDQACWSRAFVGRALRSRAPPRSSARCPRVLSTWAKSPQRPLPFLGARFCLPYAPRLFRYLRWMYSARRGELKTGRACVNAAEKKRLTGRTAAENIKLMAVPRPPQGAVERLIALGDCTGIVSATMAELGIPSAVIDTAVPTPTLDSRN